MLFWQIKYPCFLKKRLVTLLFWADVGVSLFGELVAPICLLVKLFGELVVSICLSIKLFDKLVVPIGLSIKLFGRQVSSYYCKGFWADAVVNLFDELVVPICLLVSFFDSQVNNYYCKGFWADKTVINIDKRTNTLVDKTYKPVTQASKPDAHKNTSVS